MAVSVCSIQFIREGHRNELRLRRKNAAAVNEGINKNYMV